MILRQFPVILRIPINPITLLNRLLLHSSSVLRASIVGAGLWGVGLQQIAMSVPTLSRMYSFSSSSLARNTSSRKFNSMKTAQQTMQILIFVMPVISVLDKASTSMILREVLPSHREQIELQGSFGVLLHNVHFE